MQNAKLNCGEMDRCYRAKAAKRAALQWRYEIRKGKGQRIVQAWLLLGFSFLRAYVSFAQIRQLQTICRGLYWTLWCTLLVPQHTGARLSILWLLHLLWEGQIEYFHVFNPVQKRTTRMCSLFSLSLSIYLSIYLSLSLSLPLSIYLTRTHAHTNTQVPEDFKLTEDIQKSDERAAQMKLQKKRKEERMMQGVVWQHSNVEGLHMAAHQHSWARFRCLPLDSIIVNFHSQLSCSVNCSISFMSTIWSFISFQSHAVLSGCLVSATTQPCINLTQNSYFKLGLVQDCVLLFSAIQWYAAQTLASHYGRNEDAQWSLISLIGSLNSF